MNPVFEHLQLERSGPVLRVWLDRPEVLNALNNAILGEIADAFGALRGDPDVRVIVLGGRGRAFSAGADRRDMPGVASPELPLVRRRWIGETGRRAAQAIADSDAVTIARVQSHALGGGMLLAAVCDFRVGSEDCTFRLPETELGLPLPWGGTPLLIRELGASKARELVMLGAPLGGRDALSAGLLHACVAAEGLDAEVERWVARLLALPAESVAAVKQQFRRYAAVTRLADLTDTDVEITQRVSDRPDGPDTSY